MGMGATNDIDDVARTIAERAGIAWDDLNDYPGYGKTRWREEARALIATIAPNAVFQEARGNRWDG